MVMQANDKLHHAFHHDAPYVTLKNRGRLALTERRKNEFKNKFLRLVTPYPHIFAIGDAADAFGALPTGHNAWVQGEVAGRNVLRLISRHGGNGITGKGEGEKSDEELETYTPGPPAIKVFSRSSPLLPSALALALPSFPSSSLPFPLPPSSFVFTPHKMIYQVNGTVGVTVGKETRADLNAAAMWGVFGCPVEVGEEDGEGMYR
ncbi:hypothetical protein B0H13DRAFT_2513439 [Mycena leptocephala]|nr:hypothetical protein B0H13DRAFT_2513439 [Mycena leptocephala]